MYCDLQQQHNHFPESCRCVWLPGNRLKLEEVTAPRSNLLRLFQKHRTGVKPSTFKLLTEANSHSDGLEQSQARHHQATPSETALWFPRPAWDSWPRLETHNHLIFRPGCYSGLLFFFGRMFMYKLGSLVFFRKPLPRFLPLCLLLLVHQVNLTGQLFFHFHCLFLK